jgi:two-component system cell cycle response regulator DivK
MPRLLVFESSEDITYFIVRLLSRAGHEVATASSYREAIEQAKRQPVNGILIDIGRPGSSAEAPLLYFGAMPATRGVPIVALSSRWDMSDACARRLGYAGYIHKPFLLEEFRAVIERCFGARERGRT